MKIVGHLQIGAACLLATVLQCRSVDAQDWFIDCGIGASLGGLKGVEYNDPIGSLFTPNAKDGTGIIPQQTSQDPLALAVAASAGYKLDWLFVRATYRYFGATTATANGLYFSNPANAQQIAGPFLQNVTTTAHGIFIGAGIERDLTGGWFADVSAEIGAGLMQSDGQRDIGTIIMEPFPASNHVSLAYGGGLTFGYRLNTETALTLSANWDYIGRVATGYAPDIGGGQIYARPGYPPVASMIAKLDAVSLLAGLRYSFNH
jgi:hypothetical protein